MEKEDTKLVVSLNGKDVTIDVWDIVKNPTFNKEYIIYTIDGLDKNEVFASILNEKEDSYSLDTIETEEELTFINEKIKSIADNAGDDNNGAEQF